MRIHPAWPAFALLATLACRAPQGLATYPTRDIDRPYTLPDDVDTWSTVGSWSYEGAHRAMGVRTPWQPIPAADRADFTPPIPLPLAYELSLSERVTLVGVVVPLGLKFQLHQGPIHTVGIFAGLSPVSINAPGGDVVGARLSGFHRGRIDRVSALESHLQVSAVRHEYAAEEAHLALSSGPRLQATDRVSVRARMGVEMTQLEGGNRFVRVPVGLDIKWNFHCRWSAGADYTAGTVGRQPDRHGGTLWLTHYW